jgi:hypothetical protein
MTDNRESVIKLNIGNTAVDLVRIKGRKVKGNKATKSTH